MDAVQSFPYVKMNGLGNEIVVADLRAGARVLSADEVRAIAAESDTGFDQLMALHAPRTPGTQAYVRIYNSDGSEVSACGNGTRCVGWVIANQDDGREMTLETAAGLLAVKVESQQRISVDMGEPRFSWEDIPLAEPFHDTRGIELQIGPIDDPVLHSPSVVNVGNPHAIFWVDDIQAYDLEKFGPLLENHPIFPERANISLAQVNSRKSLAVRTWERGAGITLACGTAACAAAVSAMRKKLTDREVSVNLPGGELTISWGENNRIVMTGPAETESQGVLTL